MFLYSVFVLVVYTIIPICVLITLSSKVIIHLSTYADNLTGCRWSHKIKVMKQNRRIMYMSIAILTLFILCTLPSRIITIFIETAVFNSENVPTYMTLTLISYFAYPMQSALNPILYSISAKHWRENAKKTFIWKFQRAPLRTQSELRRKIPNSAVVL